MRNISKIIFSLILLGSTNIAAALGNTLFTITPSITNLNVSSTGSTSIVYTLTNNAKVRATPSITPGYHSSGNNLTISSNTCNVALLPNASCTFRMLISGSNQPASFTITPRACGFNGFMCSVSSSAVTVTVNTPAAGLPPRAYEEVTNNGLGSTTLVGININNTSDVISSSSLNFTNGINSVVVSPDGSKVYATEIESGGHPAVVFFDVTSDALTVNQVVTLPHLLAHSAPPTNMQMALTPDGSTLFITTYTGIILKNFVPAASLFRIDVASGVATTIEDPGHILTSPRGLIVSPDGKTVYVGTDTDYLVAFPVTATSIDASNKIAQGSIPADTHVSLAIDPAGNKLYVGNYSAGSVSVLSVNGMQASLEETLLDSGSFSGATGLAISPDGATLFVAETDNNDVVAVTLSDNLTLVQPGITGAFGLGLSANGAKLYVTQGTDDINSTTVINALVFLATPTTVPISGQSLTIGKFIGS